MRSEDLCTCMGDRKGCLQWGLQLTATYMAVAGRRGVIEAFIFGGIWEESYRMVRADG